jgi:hypothetical protein
MHLSRLPILMLLVALLGMAAVADERILNFHSDIQVLPDASLVVHEVIRVSSEGERIRHGIFSGTFQPATLAGLESTIPWTSKLWRFAVTE